MIILGEQEKGFHNFCTTRMIPQEIEIQFIDYFKAYFRMYFKSGNDDVIQIMIDNLTFTEIDEYWKVFIIALRQSLDVYTESEAKRIAKMK